MIYVLTLAVLFFYIGRSIGKKKYSHFPDFIGFVFVIIYMGVVIIVKVLIDWLK
jgi:hypothetical protein